ncbi:MAG TPA: T9SS type A sorting domain-containing protein [Bacteroidota bacterium]|nr:T9SS type A sorting domain-containing protein [Bacteroidota bacterium]
MMKRTPRILHLVVASAVAWLIVFPSVSRAQVFMDADFTGDAYARIDSKGYGYEVPDCGHPVRHISELWNAELRKYVFAFVLHRDLDNDRCINFDRQRCEIKTDAGSPESMKGSRGETHTYRWKFRLDAAFQPSPNFCHIHQLKAGDGPDADSPLMTITPRSGTPNKLQLIFTAPADSAGSATVKQVELAPFLGTWVEVYEKVKYDFNSTYEVVIRRVSDDTLLFSYNNTNINMWRNGSTFIRPKYGIYRSLTSPTYLRDETVLFADFSLAEGTAGVIPAPPGGLVASAQSGGQIALTWKDNSQNEDQFRIERSADSLNWLYLATAQASAMSFVDSTVSGSKRYYYRVRSENTFGNSGFSNIAGATTKGTTGVEQKEDVPSGFSLDSFPNPFNPSTEIRYSIPEAEDVELAVYDINGREVALLVDQRQEAGLHMCRWDGASTRGEHVASGTYLARITAGKRSKTIKLMIVK